MFASEDSYIGGLAWKRGKQKARRGGPLGGVRSRAGGNPGIPGAPGTTELQAAEAANRPVT